MWSCTGTIFKALVEFVCGGKSGSHVFKLPNSWLTWVCSCSNTLFMPCLLIGIPGFVYFASYTYFSSTYFPNLPSYGRCAGEEFAAFAGMGILSSYLLLFISFYFATYKKAGQQGRKRSGTATRAAIDMSKMEIPDVGLAKSVISQSNGSVLNGHLKTNGTATASGRNPNGPITRSRKAWQPYQQLFGKVLTSQVGPVYRILVHR